VIVAVAGLVSLSSRRARFRSPSAARALAAMQEVVQPEVEHRVEAEERQEDGRSAARSAGDEAAGPR